MTSELSEFLAALFEQYTKTVQEGGDVIDAVAAVLGRTGYVIVESERWVNLTTSQRLRERETE